MAHEYITFGLNRSGYIGTDPAERSSSAGGDGVKAGINGSQGF